MKVCYNSIAKGQVYLYVVIPYAVKRTDRAYLHRISKAKIQTAATTSTITITATPASRPRSEDNLASGPADGLAPGSLDELVALGYMDELVTLGAMDELGAPVSVDSLPSESADGLVPGSLDELVALG